MQLQTTSIEDGGGQSALERAMEMGAITDEELFILLSEHEWNGNFVQYAGFLLTFC